MNNLVEFLKGKKTYFSVAIGLLYLAGVWLKFWEFDGKILAVIGFTSLAALRSGVASTLKDMLNSSAPLLLLVAVLMGVSGCASGPQRPPSAVEQHFFTVQTNYVPLVQTVTQTNWVIVTNVAAASEPGGNPPAPTMSTNPVVVTLIVTNVTPTYDLKPNAAAQAVVQTGGTVGNLFGVGGLVSTGLAGLFALWAGLRSRKSNAATAALMQIIETGKEILKTTPQGAALNAQFTAWMVAHQAEAGVIQQVTHLMGEAVDTDSARAVAQKITDLITTTKP